MAKQTITLDFKANISQAKESVVSLAQAYRQALEGGDSKQREQVNELLAQRSEAMGPGGFTMDDIAGEIKKSLDLQKEYEASSERLNELQKSSLRVEEELRQMSRDKTSLLEDASKILGKENTLKIKELRSEFALLQKNNEELEKKGQLTEEDRKKASDVLRILQQYSGILDTQTVKNKEAKKINEDIVNIEKRRQVITEEIKKILEGITLNDEERANVGVELLKNVWETEQGLKAAVAQADRLTRASENTKKEQKEVADTIASAKDSFAGKAVQAFIYYQALTALRRVARSVVSTLRELDRSLTDIAVVTSMSREQSWQLLGTYQDMAKQVGLTTTEVANLSIAFFRQGRSARDALQLTETAAKFAKIAAIDVNDAANFLTAAINGFNLAASEAERIIDRFAALGAGAAASASEIAIALSKVAPAAASAGVEIDNLMAFVTKGIETTREAPENIGTAFKTIFARMRELTDIGRVMEDGMDVNRVEKALASVGVALRDANGQFRNLDQVLIEVGKKWDTIDRNSQAYLATTLAGTRQQTRLIALFEDFDRTLELIELSQNSTGVATIQHTEFMRGMEAATKRLQTSFQELITSFANSRQIIFIINALNTTMELLNTVVGRTILVMTLLGGTIAMATKEGSKLNGVYKAMIALTKSDLLTSFGAWQKLLVKKNAALTASVQKTVLYQNAVRSLDGRTKEQLTTLRKYVIMLFGTAENKAKLTAITATQTKVNFLNLFSVKSLATGIFKLNVVLLKAIKLMLMTPLGLLVLVGGLVVGIKKLMGATDTTNVTVARLQVTFKKIGLTIQNVIKWFKDLFQAIAKGEGVLFGALKIIGTITFAPWVATFKIWKALFEASLSPVDRAAASFTVLQNRIGKLNEEIRNLDSESRKLRNTLNEFQRLSSLRFLSPEELNRLRELQTQLQLDLGTGFTGDQLIELGQKELDRVSGELTRATTERSREISQFFEDNPLAKFEDLRTTNLISDEAKANLDLVATEYATSLIEGFDAMAPDVQESLRRMIQNNIADVIDDIQEDTVIVGGEIVVGDWFSRNIFGTSKKFVVKDGEELGAAWNRGVAEGALKGLSFSEFEKAYNEQLTTTTNRLLTGPISDQAQKVAEAYSTITTEGFAVGVGEIQAILSKITDPEELERTLAVIEDGIPSIRGLAALSGTQIKGIQASGGMGALREFTAFQNLARDVFTNAAGVFDEGAANQFLDGVFDQLITADPSSRIAVGGRMIEEILAGITNVPASERNRVINAIQDLIVPQDTDNLIFGAFAMGDNLNRLTEIIGDTGQITRENLEWVTANFPQYAAEIINGTADINAIQEEYNESILEQIDAQVDSILTIMRAKQAQGELSDEEAEQLGLQLQQLQVAREYLTTSRETTEDIKERFEAQRNILKAQKQAIDDAKKLRDLQDRAAQASALSTQAVRVGAVGTIEARFNQEQLNKQIEQMNRDLEERIQIAKIEAQDRILEETQRRQLIDAQDRNTIAINTLTQIYEQIGRRATAQAQRALPTDAGGGDGSRIDESLYLAGITP